MRTDTIYLILLAATALSGGMILLQAFVNRKVWTGYLILFAIGVFALVIFR